MLFSLSKTQSNMHQQPLSTANRAIKCKYSVYGCITNEFVKQKLQSQIKSRRNVFKENNLLKNISHNAVTSYFLGAFA